jgi:endonuclease YncB( thermonuclease family)
MSHRLHRIRSAARIGAAVAIVLGAAAAGAQSQLGEVSGLVVRVTDGDSLWIQPQRGGKALEVRLQGIDAPEICQPWGPQARDALQQAVLNRTVTLRATGRDDHGRTLGTLRLEGANINERLVRDGHAWSMRWRSDRGPFVAQERMAQALQRGLHAAGGAELPRDFRRRHGPCRPGSQVPAPGR